MRILLALLICLGLLAVKPAPAQETDTEKGTAFHALKNAPYFAIGGVGIAGTISEPEKAFRVLLARKDAAAVFQSLLIEANPEGRMYALLGLKEKSKTTFRQKVSAYRFLKTDVKVMQGCILGQRPAAEIIKGIESGSYSMRKTEQKQAQQQQ